MKKLWIFALAALLVVAFTMPAAAVENIFGGYWRTRVYSQTDFQRFERDALGNVIHSEHKSNVLIFEVLPHISSDLIKSMAYLTGFN